MFCTKCGKQIDDTAAFCIHCGNNMQAQAAQPQPASQPQYPQQPQYAPQPQYTQQPYAPGYAPPKKSKTGLIVGLIVGGVVLIAAILVLVLVILPGGNADIMGKWYDIEGMGTIEFMSGGKGKAEAMGMTFDFEYSYDASKKTGDLTVDSYGMPQTTTFRLESDGSLYVEGSRFTRNAVPQQNINFDFNLDDIDWDW